MTQLRIFASEDATTPLASFSDHAVIARELSQVGVRFERWQATAPIQPGASEAEVIAAYREDIERLQTVLAEWMQLNRIRVGLWCMQWAALAWYFARWTHRARYPAIGV